MKKQPRGNRVVFKVNDAELLKLERYAAKKGTTVSELLRMYIHRLPAIHNHNSRSQDEPSLFSES
ncbi:MAG TPA: hypothetical protein DCQ63_04070 [Planktothrix sp. UBA8402]|nr:hypothetical protein [Planktothrix sp. UBA8402]